MTKTKQGIVINVQTLIGELHCTPDTNTDTIKAMASGAIKAAIKEAEANYSDAHDTSLPITERVKSFEDACIILGETQANVAILLSYNGIDNDMIAAQAFIKLTLIARALNEGWKPDWSNTSENKYYAWFKHKAGVGLSFYGYDYVYSFTDVGSRLCFKTSALAEYAGKQFENIYQDFLTL